MPFGELQNDECFSRVANLKTFDVNRRRSDALRGRCHAVLQTQIERHAPATNAALFRRIVGPVVGGAWCVAYVVEIIRRAAAMYGF